ncbi:SDR family NAD(P)-dependent oxidoreductase [Roseomonas elaeocarpi]|uniref:SDR family NAD(P)-dependent oxidoreductase n=1 Tax=Roseomonas elaeocarpi TaxID=907779 RepID=A0ABV6JNC0_9PROT
MNHTAQARPVAFVTGASYGIGAATALALADAGYRLVVADLNEGMLSETLAALATRSDGHVGVALDVTRQDSVTRVVAQAVDQLGQLDVLVNNAGVPLRKDAVDVTREDWGRTIGVNLEGTFFMSQAVGLHLIQAKRPGAIVSVASTHGLMGVPTSSTYGIAKAGISHMTRMLAIEWAPFGIRVNAIAPASTVTPTRKNLNDPDKREAFAARIPLGRLGAPQDMADAIAFLAGPRASFITGQVLAVDGGLTAA